MDRFPSNGIDLFVATGEMSGDLHGAGLIEELLKLRPALRIGAVAGPRMRKLPISEYFPMERLRVMGFIDVLLSIPRLIRQFFSIRNQILKLSPQAVVFIDYPGFHLRMEKSLRKKGYRGKLIHYICPSVWAWGKKRIPQMAETLDLLLTIFPFEADCFAKTKLPVRYVGHPLGAPIARFTPSRKFTGNILGIFPGSRKEEIERNFPIQLQAARLLQKEDPSLKIGVSITQFKLDLPPDLFEASPEDHYELMKASRLALATSGTVTLELALHKIPAIVNFAIRPLDCFIAQHIFRIDLPFYSLPNIILNRSVFPEFFGPRLNPESLWIAARKLWFDPEARKQCLKACEEVQKSLGIKEAAKEAAEAVLSSIDF